MVITYKVSIALTFMYKIHVYPISRWVVEIRCKGTGPRNVYQVDMLYNDDVITRNNFPYHWPYVMETNVP